MFYPRVAYLVRVLLSKIVIVFLFGPLVSTVCAQNEVIQKYRSSLNDWKNGSVQINGKTIIEGLVRYDRNENIVTIKTKEDTRSFNAQGVQRFEIDDADGMKYFISSPNKKTSDENATCYFFEILKECGHFALMMQEKAYTYKKVNNPVLSTPAGLGQTTRMVVVEKTLYIFDEEGNIKPYMIITESEGVAGISPLPKVKVHIVDKGLIKYHMGEGDRYTEVKAYAKKNKLSFRDRNDLVTILTYFKKLESL